MKKNLHTFFAFVLLLIGHQAFTQCNAEFTWEQLPNTLTIHFNNTSTSEHDIVSYVWHFGDGQNGDGQNPNHTYAQPGTYNVCLIITDSEGCVSDVCHMVLVEQIAAGCDAEFAWEQIPGTLTIHFNNNSTSEHDIVSNVWHFGDGHNGDGENPNHTYDEPGTYNVCLIITDEVGCVADVCHMVTVAPVGGGDCEAAFTWDQGSGLTVHFFDQSDDDPDIISWHWTFGDGGVSDDPNPHHTYDEPGVYVVCLIVENEFGCESDVCHEVVVEGGGGGDCSAAFEWEQGNGLIVHFIDHSDDDPDIISWHWTFGDGHESDDQNPVHEYAEPGVYLVCIRVENELGCVAELCHEVHVEGNSGDCSAAFEWEQGNNLVVHFIDHSDDDPDIVSWHWNFGDGHEGDGQNPVHEYAEPGVYLVCLIVTNEFGCVADVCHEVVVEAGNGDCSASFTWDLGPGLVVHFFDHSDDDPDIISWHWTFGDGHDSYEQNPVHEYAHSGVYLVCIRVENELGCVAELCHEVHVEGNGGEECHAAFTYETGSGNTIHFIDQSDDDPDIVTWQWSFGDGTSSDDPNPVHTYAEPGVYVVCLIVTNEFGCVSDVCHEVIVQGPEECEALFNFEYSENGEIVFFNNNSTGGSAHTTWLWNFGDGHMSTEENPHHNYEEPGIYTVCLTMTDSVTECYDDICIDLVYELGYEEINNNSTIETFRSSYDPPAKFNEDVIIVRYTNPASHNLNINYYVGKPTEVSFTLSDLNGKDILVQDFGNSISGNHQREVYLGNIPAGLYMIKLIMNDKAETRVLVITQ